MLTVHITCRKSFHGSGGKGCFICHQHLRHGELLTLQYNCQWPMGLLEFLPCLSTENLNQSLGITWPSIHTSETMPMSSHKGLGLCQSHLRITEVACDLDPQSQGGNDGFSLYAHIHVYCFMKRGDSPTYARSCLRVTGVMIFESCLQSHWESCAWLRSKCKVAQGEDNCGQQNKHLYHILGCAILLGTNLMVIGQWTYPPAIEHRLDNTMISTAIIAGKLPAICGKKISSGQPSSTRKKVPYHDQPSTSMNKWLTTIRLADD